MKKIWIITLGILMSLLITACKADYQTISHKDAYEEKETAIFLDVRTEIEYLNGHIPASILIAHDTIAEEAEDILTDYDQKIIVYCRSGRRSKIAAEALIELGYTNVYDLGGILTWPYEMEN